MRRWMSNPFVIAITSFAVTTASLSLPRLTENTPHHVASGR